MNELGIIWEKNNILKPMMTWQYKIKLVFNDLQLNTYGVWNKTIISTSLNS